MPVTSAHNNQRSAAVNDVLTAVPNWMIRWGNTLLFLLIWLLLAISYFVKYPDVIEAKALVTTLESPQKVILSVDRQLEVLLVSNDQEVEEDDPLVVWENMADYKDVFFLQSILDTLSTGKELRHFPMKKCSILSLGEIEPAYAAFEKQPSLSTYRQLKWAVDKWDAGYVVRAQMDSRVLLNDELSPGMRLKQGELFCMLFPNSDSSFIIRMKAPGPLIGKIREGQEVQVVLEEYPATDYGVLPGVVSRIMPLPDQQGDYAIEATLPAGLSTAYGHQIPFEREQSGQARIITNDLRLIERFFDQLRTIF